MEFEVHPADQASAIWAAANPHDFHTTKRENPRVRTVRGLHAKWRERGKAPKIETRAATLNDLRKVDHLRALRDCPTTTEDFGIN